LTVFCSLPLFAISLLTSALAAAAAAIFPRKRSRAGGEDLRKRWAADEFRFKDALAAYEALIDAPAQRHK
jgi:hypothetical protein